MITKVWDFEGGKLGVQDYQVGDLQLRGYQVGDLQIRGSGERHCYVEDAGRSWHHVPHAM